MNAEGTEANRTVPFPSPQPSPKGEGVEGMTERQIEEAERRIQAKFEANATPLPGPLLDAFLLEPVKAAGLTLQPVVAYHVTMLQAIGSPIFRKSSLPAELREEVAISHDDVYECIYLFTRPIVECRAALRKGRECFREAAIQATGDKLPPSAIMDLERAVIENLTRAFSTHVAHEEASGEGEPGTVFTRPPAEPMTGSAGG